MAKKITNSQRLMNVQGKSAQLTALLGTMSGEGHELFESLAPIDRHNLLWLALNLSEEIQDLADGIITV